MHEALDLVDVVPCSFGRVPILNSRSNTGGIHWDLLFVFPRDGSFVNGLRSEKLIVGLLLRVFALVLHFIVARVMHGRDSVVRGIVVCHFYGILLLFFVIFIRLLRLLTKHGRLTGNGIWRLVVIFI